MARLILVTTLIAALVPSAWAQGGCSSYGGPCASPGFYQMVPGPSGPFGQSYYVPGGNGPTVFVPQQQPQMQYGNSMPIGSPACNAMNSLPRGYGFHCP